MSTATAPANDIWTMPVPEPGGGDFTPCPAGNFAARLCGLFDVGHHPEEKTDEKTKAKSMIDVHKVVLVFELSKRQPDGRPYVMALKQTWSMHEKSNFFKVVVNITGAKFSPGQAFNPLTLLGLPVLVNVTQSADKKDPKKFHANVGSVTQWMEGMPQPAWKHEPVAWSVREGKPFPALPWLPMVYGKGIGALAGESSEARGFTGATAAVSAADARGPVTTSRTYYSNLSDYSDEAAALIAKYKLEVAYRADDVTDRADITPADKDILLDFANAF